MTNITKKSLTMVYMIGGIFAAMVGFSVVWTMQDLVAKDLRRSVSNSFPAPPENFPMGVQIIAQSDGWTAYTRNIIREATATWVASVIGKDGKILCRGTGRTNYRPESSGTFYWDISYFVNDPCPTPLPVGAFGTLMYIFDGPEPKRPLVIDFKITPKTEKIDGEDRPPITRWIGYDTGEPMPLPDVPAVTASPISPSVYYPQNLDPELKK